MHGVTVLVRPRFVHFDLGNTAMVCGVRAVPVAQQIGIDVLQGELTDPPDAFGRQPHPAFAGDQEPGFF